MAPAPPFALDNLRAVAGEPSLDLRRNKTARRPDCIAGIAGSVR